MAINKKLIHFLNKINFLDKLEAGEILDTSIVFIKDAKQIWTHGELYSCSYTVDEILALINDKVPITRTINDMPLSSDITLTAEIILADERGSAASALTSAKSYTDTKISELVGQAPDALNTVYELAEAMLSNQSAVDALEAAIGNKVDKVSGKGLSTNDYTTEEKNKLANLSNTKVTQTVTTANSNYPLLLAPSGQTATTTTTSYFNTGIYANASTKSVYATHFYETSDRQFKTNIESILNSNNCPKIRQFNWKENGSRSYGFIAQELEELGYEELVDINEENGSKTVNYSAALSLVVGKMLVKIEELEKKISELEDKLANKN